MEEEEERKERKERKRRRIKVGGKEFSGKKKEKEKKTRKRNTRAASTYSARGICWFSCGIIFGLGDAAFTGLGQQTSI